MLLALGFVACTKPVQKEIQQSVDKNQRAKSILEWDSAKENPRNLFARLRDEVKTNSELGQEVCDGLVALKGQDLSLFEEEINKSENLSILKNCHDSLKQTLEKYWHEQKKLLEQTSGLNFQFQPRVEKRDLSKGYRAATGDVQPKELILTFDDGPNTELTPQILDILKSVNAKVMFFTLGPHVRENPTIVTRAATEGHVLGSHSLTHRCLANNAMCTKANNGTPLAYDEAVAEIRGGHQAVYDTVGFVDPFFRFPYGESDPALVTFLAERQVAQMYWSIDSTDWKAQSNPDLLKVVLDQVDKNQRGIVLFHDIQRRTLEILPEFLKAIYERGYTLVVLQSMDDNARYNSQLVTKAPVIP
jgi:peptidoglycan/xylan/chitin deacetylase (PgdA/CDA1 family)